MTVLDKVKGQITKSKEGTLFFNNSFPQYDEEYVRNPLEFDDLIKRLQTLQERFRAL